MPAGAGHVPERGFERWAAHDQAARRFRRRGAASARAFLLQLRARCWLPCPARHRSRDAWAGRSGSVPFERGKRSYFRPHQNGPRLLQDDRTVPRSQRLKVQARNAPAPMPRPRAAAPHTRHAVIDKTQSPVEQAYNHILQSILSGELTPGMRVPAETVAETLGISRMPVRDALRRLEGDGAIVISPNRGAAVAADTPHQVVQLIQMRAVLEG